MFILETLDIQKMWGINRFSNVRWQHCSISSNVWQVGKKTFTYLKNYYLGQKF